MLADRFGQRANVMRTGAAAYAQVADAHRQRVATEVGEFEPVAGERIERDRKRLVAPIAMPVTVAQRLERRLLVVRPERDRQRRHRHRHHRADLLEQRHHRFGTANAVEPDHVGTGVLQPLARIGHAPVFTRHVGLVHRQRDHRGLLRSLDHFQRDQRLLAPRKRLADDEIDAGIDRPADLLLEHRAHGFPRFGICGIEDVGIADVAGQQRAAFVGHCLGQFQRTAIHRLEVVLAADDAQLFAMRIVGQRLDDVGAGVDKIAMQLGDDFRMFDDDFRNECPGLQIPAPFEFEQVTLGADHRACFEALHQRELSGRRHGAGSFAEGIKNTISYASRRDESRCDRNCRRSDVQIA